MAWSSKIILLELLEFLNVWSRLFLSITAEWKKEFSKKIIACFKERNIFEHIFSFSESEGIWNLPNQFYKWVLMVYISILYRFFTSWNLSHHEYLPYFALVFKNFTLGKEGQFQNAVTVVFLQTTLSSKTVKRFFFFFFFLKLTQKLFSWNSGITGISIII